MKKTITLIILATTTLFVFADGPVQDLTKYAETAFAKGDFKCAKEYYIKITTLEVSTKEQVNKAFEKINICNKKIKSQELVILFNKANKAFQDAKYHHCLRICNKLLASPNNLFSYKQNVRKLILMCNDSISAIQAKEFINQELLAKEALNNERNIIIDRGEDNYHMHNYIAAIECYDSILSNKYNLLPSLAPPQWYIESKEILTAQQNKQVTTQELSNTFIDIPIKYYEPIGIYTDGFLFKPRIGRGLILITKDGKKTILENAVPFITLQESLQSELIPIYNGSQSYYMNINNKILISATLTGNKEFYTFGVNPFRNGYSTITNGKGKIYTIDERGRKISNKKLRAEPTYFVAYNDNAILYDKNLNFLESLDYSAGQGNFSSDCIILYKFLKRSLIQEGFVYNLSKKRKYYFPKEKQLNWMYASYIDEKRIFIKEEGSGGYIWTPENNSLIFLDSIWKFIPAHKEQGIYIAVKKDYSAPNKYYFVNDNGQSLIDDVYDEATPFHDGFAFVRKNDKCYFIDTKGNVLRNSVYQYTKIGIKNNNIFAYGFGFIQKDGKWGVIDKYGISTFDYQ